MALKVQVGDRLRLSYYDGDRAYNFLKGEIGTVTQLVGKKHVKIRWDNGDLRTLWGVAIRAYPHLHWYLEYFRKLPPPTPFQQRLQSYIKSELHAH